MISEGEIAVMQIVARAGSAVLAMPLVREHMLSDLDAEVTDETVGDLVAQASINIIDSAPDHFTFQKACGLFLIRILLNEVMSADTPSVAQAFSLQVEINRMLSDT